MEIRFDNDSDAVIPCTGTLEDKAPFRLPNPVDGSGQPLVSSELTTSTSISLQAPILSLFSIDPLCSRVSCDDRLPSHLNTQHHTQGVHSTNQVLIEKCREEAVVEGQNMDLPAVVGHGILHNSLSPYVIPSPPSF